MGGWFVFLVSAVPPRIWVGMGVFVIGLLGGAVGMNYYHTGNWTPTEPATVRTAGPRTISEIPADPWQDLTLHTRDTTRVLDSTCAVIPREVLALSEEEGGENALPGVQYDPDLFDAPTPTQSPGVLPDLSYAILPLRAGHRPTVSVGPDRVEVYGTNPNTGAGLTWGWAVPKPLWEVHVSGGVGASFGRDSLHTRGLQASLAAHITRHVGDRMSLRLSPRYSTAGWQGRIGLQYRLFTVGTR